MTAGAGEPFTDLNDYPLPYEQYPVAAATDYRLTLAQVHARITQARLVAANRGVAWPATVEELLDDAADLITAATTRNRVRDRVLAIGDPLRAPEPGRARGGRKGACRRWHGVDCGCWTDTPEHRSTP